MELIEAPQRGLHLHGAFVGLGNEHHQGVHRVASRAHQQLERVVQAGRVASLRPDDGLEPVHRLAPGRSGQRGLAGPHRVTVPPQGIDLAVVREHPEGLSQRPARRRVGGVTLVKDRNRRLVVRGREVGEEAGQLRAREQRLVHQRAARERAHEERIEAGPRVGDAALDGPARKIEGAFPRGLVEASALDGRGDDGLPDGGARPARPGAQLVHVQGHVAPRQHGQPLPLEHLLDNGCCAPERVVLAGQEERADGERLPWRERDPAARGLTVEERGGNLREQAGTIARAVRRRSAAVGDPRQRLQREARDVGGAVSRRARHEPDAAGVLLPPGVEPSRAGLGPTRSVSCGHRCSSSRPVNRKARSAGSGPGGLLCVVYALTPAVRSHRWESPDSELRRASANRCVACRNHPKVLTRKH